MEKDGPVHISRAHMCTLCYIFNGTAETPVLSPMMELMATALRPSFILLGCIEEEAGHKSPREEQVVCVQKPKLKLQSMDDGEPRTEAMRPCLNTTTRALWRTASTSHFFVCKVWIFRSFSGFFFLWVFFYAFAWYGIHGVQGRGGGIITFSKRGT
jgi:hypothetical protein